MLDKTLEKVKNCMLEKQGGSKINWTRAAKEIGLPKTTLWQIFEEGRSPTWRNLAKVLEYTECYITCPPKKKIPNDGRKKTKTLQGAVANKGRGKIV